MDTYFRALTLPVMGISTSLHYHALIQTLTYHNPLLTFSYFSTLCIHTFIFLHTPLCTLPTPFPCVPAPTWLNTPSTTFWYLLPYLLQLQTFGTPPGTSSHTHLPAWTAFLASSASLPSTILGVPSYFYHSSTHSHHLPCLHPTHLRDNLLLHTRPTIYLLWLLSKHARFPLPHAAW